MGDRNILIDLTLVLRKTQDSAARRQERPPFGNQQPAKSRDKKQCTAGGVGRGRAAGGATPLCDYVLEILHGRNAVCVSADSKSCNKNKKEYA